TGGAGGLLFGTGGSGGAGGGSNAFTAGDGGAGGLLFGTGGSGGDGGPLQAPCSETGVTAAPAGPAARCPASAGTVEPAGSAKSAG
ncbi:PE family protein, partial [Mycobacterium ulcerans]